MFSHTQFCFSLLICLFRLLLICCMCYNFFCKLGMFYTKQILRKAYYIFGNEWPSVWSMLAHSVKSWVRGWKQHSALTEDLISVPNTYVTQLTTAFTHIYKCINKVQTLKMSGHLCSLLPTCFGIFLSLFLDRIFYIVSSFISLMNLDSVCYAGCCSKEEVKYHLRL